MMSARGVGMAHTTILRWVQHSTPEFEKRWKRFARPVGGSWRMDETYIKVRRMDAPVSGGGQSREDGRFPSEPEARRERGEGLSAQGREGSAHPREITLDTYAASHRAVAELKDNGELPKRVPVRTSKYLNNLIEQDHRRVKQRLRPMLGLKSLRTAAVVNQRHRAGREDQEETVSDKQTRRTHRNDAGDLACCLGCIVSEPLQRTDQNPSNLTHFRIRTRAV